MMNKSQQKQFDNLMNRAYDCIEKKRYADALAKVSEAEKLLEMSNEVEQSAWAYIYDYKRFSLYELGHKDKAMEVCERAIHHLAGNDWAYLTEDNIVRATLRASHNMIAGIKAETAETETAIAQAVAHIDACFSTISPTEDEDVLHEFYDTKALVYLKASQYHDSYRLTAFTHKSEI